MSVRFRLPDDHQHDDQREAHRDLVADTICADARIAPRKAYFEFDAQPAMITP